MNSFQMGMFDGSDHKPKNTALVEYGIQNEESHFRAHVCYDAQRVYIFPTDVAKRLLETGKYELRKVMTKGIVTATGYPVPVSHIQGIQEILIPLDLVRKYRVESSMATGLMGKLATLITAEMIRSGLIPLPVQVDVTDDKSLQIDGTDIIVSSALHIQVKLDRRGGDRRYGGTGNLFLQISECNPFRQY